MSKSTTFESIADNWDVVVVGGGPAGTAAAIGAAREGMRILQVDAKKFPRDKVCGGCMNQVTIGLLKRLVGEKGGGKNSLWTKAQSLNEFRVYAAGRQLDFPTPAGLSIERSVLDVELTSFAQSLGVSFLSPAMATLGESHSGYRTVTLRSGGIEKCVRASVVVLATGLGRIRAVDEQLQQTTTGSSRLGVATKILDVPPQYLLKAIHMAVGDIGYVGLTQMSDRNLHLAAAVDRKALQDLGPERTVQKILSDAGAPDLVISDVNWQGTPPLTARANVLGSNRTFLVGDAAGYIEPFTGEGIGWALRSGMGVVPFLKAATENWDDSLIANWAAWHKTHIQSRQSLCRQISFGLKHAPLRWIAYQALRLQPRIAQPFIRRINGV